MPPRDFSTARVNLCSTVGTNRENTSDSASRAKQLAAKSVTGVAVAVKDGRADLSCLELTAGHSLLSVKSDAPGDYRRLGKNTARYLKNKKFDI